jgi:hypothetical protein
MVMWRDIALLAVATVAVTFGAATALNATDANPSLSAAVLLVIAIVLGSAAGIVATRR